MQRILIIDDDALVHSAIRKVLEGNGFDVSVASDGWAGLKAVETATFDIILVDIFMPGMDGLETVRVLRQSLPTVPIIAMSGRQFRYGSFSSVHVPDYLSMALEFGANQTLHKPFTPEELFRKIEACLAKRNNELEMTGIASIRPVRRREQN